MILYLILLFTVCSARSPFPDQTDNNFENECLSATNSYRAKHHAPKLSINQDAVAYAKSRCQLISQYDGLSNGHAGLQGYGENLFWDGSSSPTVYSCQSAIDSWYNEVNQYNYKNPGFSSNTGHFTQLVWKSTTSVGCARCGGLGSQWYETYIVCDYSPLGNYGNQLGDNVLRP